MAKKVHITGETKLGGGDQWYKDFLGIFDLVEQAGGSETITMNYGDLGDQTFYEVNLSEYKGKPNAVQYPDYVRLFVLESDAFVSPP